MNPEIERRLRLRSRLPLYLLGLLVVLQLLMPDRTWSYLLGGLGALVLFSYLWAREMRQGVFVERKTRGAWVVSGDELQEQFRLVNRSPLPVLWANIADHSDIPGYAINRVVATGGNGRYDWTSGSVCSQRGVFTVGPWSVHMGDPFGLFDVAIAYPEVRSLLVYPRVMRLPGIELPRGRASGRAARTVKSPAESILPHTVRAYAPGDSLRIIHWRKTAQQQRLMVKEFDVEPSGALWLVLDLDAAVQAGAGEESTLEYGITLAASLAARYLDQNRAVGLVAFGQEAQLTPAQQGRDHLWRILPALAHAESGDAWPLARVLKQAAPNFGRGCTLVLITPSTAAGWVGELLNLQRKDIAAAALLLDAASFTAPEGAGEPEDQPLITDHRPLTTDHALPRLRGLLADYGIPSHVIARGYPFRPLITVKRRRTVYKRLLGAGRAIPVEIEEEL